MIAEWIHENNGNIIKSTNTENVFYIWFYQSPDIKIKIAHTNNLYDFIK